jgi:hypothetical protein
MTIEEAVDQVQMARSAAPRADRELIRQVRLGACRESRDLLVPDMHPLDLALAAQRVGQSIQAVADNTVDPPDAGCSEGSSKLIRDNFCQLLFPLLERFRITFVFYVQAPLIGLPAE